MERVTGVVYLVVIRLKRDQGPVSQRTITADLVAWGLGEGPMGMERMTGVVDLAVTLLERKLVPRRAITTDLVAWGETLGERPVGTEWVTGVGDLALKTWSNNLRSTETRRWIPALTPQGLAYLPTVVLPEALATGRQTRRRRRLGHLLPLSRRWNEIPPLSCRPDPKLKPQITTSVDR